MADPKVLTVKFCDIARNPTAFCDKTVRLDAVFEPHDTPKTLPKACYG